MNIARYFIAFMLLMVSGEVAFANQDMMESINVLFEKENQSAIQLKLNFPFMLVAIDSEDGNQCSIRVQPTNNQLIQSITHNKERKLWSPTASIPLLHVEAEKVAEQFMLQFNFQNTVHCVFQASRNQRAVLLTLSKESKHETDHMVEKMEQGRRAIAQGHYKKAENIYRELLKLPSHPLQQEALEYLGVALEKQQHYKEANKIYQSYLKQYPNSNGSARVQQRLQGLVYLNSGEFPTLQKPKPRQRKGQWKSYGFIGTGYQLYRAKQTETQWQTFQSTLTTDLNAGARYRSESIDAKLYTSLGYWYDVEESLDEPGRLSRLYADLYFINSDLQWILGRQSISGEGVLGRMDGARLRKKLNDRYRININVGYPVLSSHDIEINTDTSVTSISLDIEGNKWPWVTNLFYVKQQTGAYSERQAIGSELSWQAQAHNYVAYLDYDIQFNELNTLLLNSNWYGKQDSHTFVSLDYRRSPTLTLSNALIGQSIQDLESFGLNSDELEEIALDRSAVSQTITLGTSRRFLPKYRWSVTSNAWRLKGTPESVGVPALLSTDWETNVSLQLTANDLFKESNLTWLTFRFANLTQGSLISFNAETRYPVSNRSRIRPRLFIYQRHFDIDGGSERSIQPQIKWQMEINQSWNVEMQAGIENLQSSRGVTGTQQRSNYFLLIRSDWRF